LQPDWLTEQNNAHASGLDQKPVSEILRIINAEDQRVPETVGRALDQIEPAVEAFVDAFRRGGRVFYGGAGTSGRLGVLDAAECPPTFGVAPARVQGVLAGGQEAFFEASEGAEDDRDAGHALLEERAIEPPDLLVGIAASGETPFVLGAVEGARACGVRTVGICNNPEGALARLAELPIVAAVGPEVVAGSTRMKAGTAQKLILNMLSTTAMVKLGKVYDGYMVDVKASNHKLRRRAAAILHALTGATDGAITEALAQTGYEVKPALLMLKGGIPRARAVALLEEHHGMIRAALRALGREG